MCKTCMEEIIKKSCQFFLNLSRYFEIPVKISMKFSKELENFNYKIYMG